MVGTRECEFLCRKIKACLVGQKVYNGNGNGNKCNGVKIESRGKLGNDEK